MNISHWITWNRSTNQRRDCLSPCNFLLINVGSKNSRIAANATLGHHQLFFAPRRVFDMNHEVEQRLKHYLGIMHRVGKNLARLWTKFHTVVTCQVISNPMKSCCRVMQSKENYLYTGLSLFAEIGGNEIFEQYTVQKCWKIRGLGCVNQACASHAT